ncbi:MAG: 5-bromo-4-chloroindolyl phosphate hydrolysis family protein [Peptococcaceae bacterium]|nr:5-bromo-4-chloroindolyl phosphate hydrolysis family protein [Peptococcaceae bacterium]
MGHKKDLSEWIGDITQEIIHHKDPSQLKAIGRDIRDAVIKNITHKKNEPPPDTFHEPQQDSHTAPAHAYAPTATAAKISREPKWWMGLPTLVLSILGLIIFGLAAITLGILSVAIPAFGNLFGVLCAVSTLPVLLFVFLTVNGVSKRRLALRTRQIISLMKEKSVRTLDEITSITRETSKTVKKDIRRATKKHMLSGVRMDDQETCLIYGEEAYRLYRESEQNRQEHEAAEKERLQRMNTPELANLESFKTQKIEVLRKIRACHDAFPDSDMSEKLSKLQTIIEKIFIYVETHPKKLPLTRKFTSYYLPLTLKLVDKYQQFDRMDAESARNTKKDIENALDTVYSAFCTLLEHLTEEDVLDVSTDIKVLETMLAQEGLTGQKFDIGKGAGIS